MRIYGSAIDDDDVTGLYGYGRGGWSGDGGSEGGGKGRIAGLNDDIIRSGYEIMIGNRVGGRSGVSIQEREEQALRDRTVEK